MCVPVSKQASQAAELKLKILTLNSPFASSLSASNLIFIVVSAVDALNAIHTTRSLSLFAPIYITLFFSPSPKLGPPRSLLQATTTMSRPTTPHGISPRGSYVNLLEGREEGAFSPSKIEKERLRAEAEVNAALLKDKEGDKKKEEAPVAAGSPGESMPSPDCPDQMTARGADSQSPPSSATAWRPS